MDHRLRWVADQVRFHGAVGGARVLGERLAGRAYLVRVRDLRLPLPPIPTARVRLSRQPITEANLPMLAKLHSAMTEAEIRRRWREGQQGLLYLADGVPAYYRWDTTHSIFVPELGVLLRLEDGDNYSVDVYTHPDFRGRGIFGVAAVEMLHRVREQGCRRLVDLVAPYNTPSLRTGRERLESCVIGRVGYWGHGPLRRYYVQGALRLHRGTLELLAMS